MAIRKKITFLKVVLGFYLFIALFANIIANDKPINIKIRGKNYFPALSGDAYINVGEEKILMNSADWKNISAERKIFAPVQWSPVKSDLINTYASPFEKQFAKDGTELNFSQRHFLGTGKLGNDILSSLIHGTRTSVSVGILSMLIAVFIGILYGGTAGYFGDTKIKASPLQLILSACLLIPAWFYAFHLRSMHISISFSISALNGMADIFISLVIFKFIVVLPFLFRSKKYLKGKVNVPIDSIISRFIEIFIAVPKLILILTIAALSKPSIQIIIILIGITSWTEIARVVRSQLLYLRKQQFIEAAQISGMSSIQILIRHILPNIKDQVLSIAMFGVAAAILMETGLSFLGIGVPPSVATWGQIMFEARQHYSAWWLVVFPGIAISGLLYALYSYSQKSLRREMN